MFLQVQKFLLLFLWKWAQNVSSKIEIRVFHVLKVYNVHAFMLINIL